VWVCFSCHVSTSCCSHDRHRYQPTPEPWYRRRCSRPTRSGALLGLFPRWAPPYCRRATIKRFLGAFARLQKAAIRYVMSVRPSACNNSAPTRRISINLLFECFRKSVEKFQVSSKSDKNNSGTLLEDKYSFLIISRSVLLRMRNVSDKSCRENQNTQLMLSKFKTRMYTHSILQTTRY